MHAALQCDSMLFHCISVRFVFRLCICLSDFFKVLFGFGAASGLAFVFFQSRSAGLATRVFDLEKKIFPTRVFAIFDDCVYSSSLLDGLLGSTYGRPSCVWYVLYRFVCPVLRPRVVFSYEHTRRQSPSRSPNSAFRSPALVHALSASGYHRHEEEGCGRRGPSPWKGND